MSMCRANADSDGIRWPAGFMTVMTALRFLIGWHFLYEGLIKLSDPYWSSAGYLSTSNWVFADLFHRIAVNPFALRAVDLLNMWGLTFIGLGLMFGFLSRVTSLMGVFLLATYYAAHPPFVSAIGGSKMEGSYLFIDKNIIEAAALLLLACAPTGRFLGIDGLLAGIFRKRAAEEISPDTTPTSATRRELLRHAALLPGAGAFIYAYQKKRGWETFEVQHLLDFKKTRAVDGISGATMKALRTVQMSELKGKVPHAKIGTLELSRLILGGNLIGGWAHSRDLIYVSDLVKAYHTDEKVFQTLRMAEQCGVNTIVTNPRLSRVINDYWKKEGGKIQFISDCAKGGALEGIRESIDGGAHACYVQGGMADSLVEKGDFDTVEKALDLIRKNGLPAGLGAHKLTTIKAFVERGFKPDFWVKTLHKTNYWSAQPQPEHDNIWCVQPDETIAFMEQLPEPWIAFKILAAGAIHPQEGFPYALKNGADFICVGMYDFQVVEDVNLFLDVYANTGERKRPWRA